MAGVVGEVVHSSVPFDMGAWIELFLLTGLLTYVDGKGRLHSRFCVPLVVGENALTALPLLGGVTDCGLIPDAFELLHIEAGHRIDRWALAIADVVDDFICSREQKLRPSCPMDTGS